MRAGTLPVEGLRPSVLCVNYSSVVRAPTEVAFPLCLLFFVALLPLIGSGFFYGEPIIQERDGYDPNDEDDVKDRFYTRSTGRCWGKPSG